MGRKSYSVLKAESRKRGKKTAYKMAPELELHELREALWVSQMEMARKLGTTQAAVSRLERRKNTRLFTLQNYLEVLGAQLELRVILPDRVIKLNHTARKKAKWIPRTRKPPEDK
jgi:DNA-binding transcriptional regulator YiaG